VAAHPLIARQAVAQHQDATQLIVAVQQNELQVVPQLQPDVRALSALIQSDQVAMMIDRVEMKIVQSALGQVNDRKQVMIADLQADQVQADHQVAAQVQADHQVAAQVLIVRTQIVHVVMMIVHVVMMIARNVLVTKNQNVVNGQANDLKQVMIDDQQVDQVHVRQAVVHQLADQHQIVRIPIVHAAMMIVHAPTVLIQIAHVLIDQHQIARIPIVHVVMIAQVVLVGIVRVSHGMIVAVMTVLAMIAHVVVVLIALVVGLLVMKMSVQHVTFLKSELTLMTRSSLITSPVKNYHAQFEMNFAHCQTV
jgi:hypothetical protein